MPEEAEDTPVVIIPVDAGKCEWVNINGETIVRSDDEEYVYFEEEAGA